MVLANLLVAIREELIEHLGMRLDKLSNVRVLRRFRHFDALRGLLDRQLDLIGVAKDFAEQRIAHVDRPSIEEPPMHRLDV